MYVRVSLASLVPVEGIGSPGTAVVGGGELSRGCWESNSSPLEEQQQRQ